jgi:hypothetical protein
MSKLEMMRPTDLDVQLTWPPGLSRVVEQNLIDLAPWHIMPRDLAKKRLQGLRLRYTRRYVPFARRQDNDDLACIDPEQPEHIVIVHDYASAGSERRQTFPSFWDWFRAAVEDMIAFE